MNRLTLAGRAFLHAGHNRPGRIVPARSARGWLPARRRAGSLLVELLICGVLLGVVTSAIIPTLQWIVRQRAFGRQRQAVVLEVGNLMERITRLRWEELTAERAAEFELPATLKDQLDEPRLVISIGEDEAADAKHVRVELAWRLAPDRPAPPVRLSAWVYKGRHHE